MPSDKPKILFVMDKELLTRIDDYRFNNRINSRSEAVRLLIEEGLRVIETSNSKAEKK